MAGWSNYPGPMQYDVPDGRETIDPVTGFCIGPNDVRPTEYRPLMLMNTLGEAYVDYDGAIVESAEYVAAFYESAYADEEWNRGDTYLTGATVQAYGESLASLGAYCTAAQRLAEDLWTRDLESTVSDAELHYVHGVDRIEDTEI